MAGKQLDKHDSPKRDIDTLFDIETPEEDESLKRFEAINKNDINLVPLRREGPKSPQKLTRIKCWPEAEKRLRAGFSPERVAEYIQDECNEYTGVMRKSLTTMLYEYRRHKMPDIEKVQTSIPDYAAKAYAKVEAGINEVNELGTLYALQMARIEMALNQEQDNGFLNANLNNTFKLAQQILTARAEIKMGAGMAIDEADLSSKEAVLRRVGNKMSGVLSSNDSRAKVLSVLNKLKRIQKYDKEDIEEVIGEQVTDKSTSILQIAAPAQETAITVR